MTEAYIGKQDGDFKTMTIIPVGWPTSSDTKALAAQKIASMTY